MKTRKITPPLVRLMNKVEIDPATECWNFTGARDRKGYGKFSVNRNTWRFAHRCSYEMHVGPIPDGLHILHSCDNPSCCNPAHLRAGTSRENHADMVERKRWSRHERPRGTDHARAKLNPVAVAAIKRLRAGGMIYREIAAIFDVHLGTIYAVCVGKTWNGDEAPASN